jgi:hypothetical protein
MASVNLKRPLTEHQIDEIALLILSEFNNVTLADIYLVLKNAKLGKYGSFYESLDCPKVMSWFNEYMEERISAHMNRSQTEHNQTKSASRTAESATEYLNKLQAKEYLKNNNT